MSEVGSSAFRGQIRLRLEFKVEVRKQTKKKRVASAQAQKSWKYSYSTKEGFEKSLVIDSFYPCLLSYIFLLSFDYW